MLDRLLPLARSYLSDVVKVKLTASPLLEPLGFTYYITLRCNFQCSFCGFAQHKETSNELSTEEVIKLLKILRASSSTIYFTGGEPLIRDDIVEILQATKQLGFRSISLNTNLSLMHRRMESLKYIDNLVVSINQMDNEKIADTKGISLKIAQQVKENLTTCLKLREKEKFPITINCVVTHESIEDTYDIIEYCSRNHIHFAIVPAELEYGYLDRALVNDVNYKDLIRFVIRRKASGLSVFNSFLYLNCILTARKFTCYPTLTPHVYPNGDLFYPCQPMRQIASNILEVNSYRKALREGFRNYGNIPKCDGRCYIACYIEPSMAVDHPFRYLFDLTFGKVL